MSEEPLWTWVDEPAGLKDVARAMRGSKRVAVDTESDSMHSYFEKVCLIQIATEERAFLVDPLALNGDLAALAPIFASRKIMKIFHGADYDVVCLKRDFGFEIRAIFDTMVAAQCLDVQKFGLADLVSAGFGDVLEKKHSRTDWARRPLSDSELLYSYLDVKYLIELSHQFEARLKEADVFEEAVLEFLRLEEREQTPREFDSDGYLRIRGNRDLSPVQLAVLRELYLIRDRRSRAVDRPPFKVLANDTLLRISRSLPKSMHELSDIRGITRFVIRRQGEQILKAVARGVSRGQPPKPRKKASRSARLNPRQQGQMEHLKDWRKVAASRRGVPNLVVLPNHAVLEVVIEQPGDLKALAALPTVGKKRARVHGEEILEILKR